MTVRVTIAVTDQDDIWIKKRIASGHYASESEYVRDLIRRDQQEHQKLQTLRVAIQEGLDSGVSSRSVKDIMREIEQRLK